IERLTAFPDARLVGIEIKRKWSTIVDERLKNLGLGARGRVFCGDIRLVLPRFVEHSVSIAYFHFPDPWWKKRHHKRLVLSLPLLDELARVTVPGGELFIQTDVDERARAYESIVAAHPRFRPCGESPVVLETPYAAMNPRERRAVRDGLPIFRLRDTLR